MTKDELKELLDEAEVPYNKTATKEELQALVDEHIDVVDEGEDEDSSEDSGNENQGDDSSEAPEEDENTPEEEAPEVLAKEAPEEEIPEGMVLVHSLVNMHIDGIKLEIDKKTPVKRSTYEKLLRDKRQSEEKLLIKE